MLGFARALPSLRFKSSKGRQLNLMAVTAYPTRLFHHKIRMLNVTMTALLRLPAIEKLKIIEALWSDLIAEENTIPELLWHENQLKQTETELLFYLYVKSKVIPR